MLRKPGLAMGAIPRNQLVTTGSADPETTTKRTDIAAFLHGKTHKLQLPIHHAGVPKWQREPPGAEHAKLFAMSSHTCSRCPRSKQYSDGEKGAGRNAGAILATLAIGEMGDDSVPLPVTI
ncbi:hypothetical protein, partial [Mesorhizobium sp. M7A.F.Ca.CA.001.11.2.1]